MRVIRDMWKFAEAAKHEPTGTELLFKNAIFTVFKNDMDYMYIAEFNDRIIMSFRGSQYNLKAWINDFDTYPLKDDLLKKGPWGDGIIHDGFYTAWSRFKQRVDVYLKEYLKRTRIDVSVDDINKIRKFDFGRYIDKPIFCTAHSRGAALVTLCSRHLAKNCGISNSCISFGSPAQGIKEYRDQYNKLPIDHTRVVNGYDIVPKFPPRALDFRHVGKLFWMKQPWWHWLFCKIYDHFYSSYERKIDKL